MIAKPERRSSLTLIAVKTENEKQTELAKDYLPKRELVNHKENKILNFWQIVLTILEDYQRQQAIREGAAK